MSASEKTASTYDDAGVSIDRGNALVERISSRVSATHRPGVMGGLGGFGALFDMSALNYREPVLVSGTDGVGTKIKLAIDAAIHDSIGIDLVAMCVNDLLVQGAEPLFFLDYFASSRLDVDVAEQVIAGIAKGCELAGCALVGGETAEMPGMYRDGDYDLAGFCVGVVEKSEIIDGSLVTPGNVLLGLASSGLHANGYSLVRFLLEREGCDLQGDMGGRPLIEALMAPTRIYVRAVHTLLKSAKVGAMAHITGGGLTENLPRVLPDNTRARIDTGSWQWPGLFGWLQGLGNIDTEEMYRTFNCGIGLVLVVTEADVERSLQCLQDSGEKAWVLGKIEKSDGPPTVSYG